MSIVNYRSLDENAISVNCSIEGCNARVVGAERCQAHGGNPDYQWSTSAWGETRYVVRATPKGATNADRIR